MKAKTNYRRSVQYLSKVAKQIDFDWFNGELEGKYTITLQSAAGTHGHCTLSPVWSNTKGEATYEINISAETCSREIYEVCATIIHEFTHLINILHGVPDTSNGGFYHNKRFKNEAEKHGIIIERHPVYGWTITTATDELIDWCIACGFEELSVQRNTPYIISGFGNKAGNGTTKPKTKTKSNSIKWICPVCGAIIRSTKEVNVICGDCNEKFVKA